MSVYKLILRVLTFLLTSNALIVIDRFRVCFVECEFETSGWQVAFELDFSEQNKFRFWFLYRIKRGSSFFIKKSFYNSSNKAPNGIFKNFEKNYFRYFLISFEVWSMALPVIHNEY